MLVIMSGVDDHLVVLGIIRNLFSRDAAWSDTVLHVEKNGFEQLGGSDFIHFGRVDVGEELDLSLVDELHFIVGEFLAVVDAFELFCKDGIGKFVSLVEILDRREVESFRELRINFWFQKFVKELESKVIIPPCSILTLHSWTLL